MRTPKMILFDYGSTLLHELEADYLRGEEAVFQHVTDNPHGITPAEAARLGTELFLSARPCRHSGWELHEHQQLRLKYDLLGLRFDLPIAEVEKLLWATACPGVPTPGVQEMLSDLRQRGIRTAVISNLCWTGDALADRLARFLPAHQFEFVIASSDYGVRKPSPLIFRAALSRAGVIAQDAWYCGDQPEADVQGARQAGLFPVWYEDASFPQTLNQGETLPISDTLLHIRHWRELTAFLDQCK